MAVLAPIKRLALHGTPERHCAESPMGSGMGGFTNGATMEWCR
jgi:hypothetical protein